MNSLNKRSLEHLISDSVKQNLIDARLFWEVRDFSSLGHLVLDKSKQDPNPFLTFTSKTWKSSEILTDSTTLIEADPNIHKDCQEDILKTTRDIICKMSDGRMLVAFIRNQEEMRRANVFFDPKHDAELIKGKHWLVTSYIE